MEALGREVLHLELGEPDFPTPPHIVEAGLRALRNGATKYAPAAGIPELRDAIAACAQTRGLAVSAENVLVTSGSKPMLYYALLALVHPGDEVLVPDPGFPIYESVVRFAGGVPVRYGVSLEQQEAISLREITARISPKTRVFVLNTPHNPTGAVLNLGTAVALAEMVHRHDLTVVSDEIYSRLVFGGWQGSIAALAEMTDRTVVVDGFSKAYAMTGWRLGYGIAPVELIRRLERFVVNTTSCAPPFVQQAGLAALTGPQDCVDEMREEYRARRDLLVCGLDYLDGVSCAMPRGAFYAFPRISEWLEELKLTTELFADVLLQEFGLACLPGTAFGPGGAEHLRLSFATSQVTLRRALELLRDAAPVGLRSRAPSEIEL
jgi:aspartate aminotransferase